MAQKNPLDIIRFWAEVRPGRNPIHMVELASPTAISPQGVRTHSTNHRVKDLRPVEDNAAWGNLPSDTQMLIRARWDIIGPAYEAWKSGQEMPLTGTPLAAWSTISGPQAEALRMAGFRSIEQVAEAHESQLMAIRLPNAAVLRDAARQWLGSQDAAAKEQRIADLEAKLAAMADMMAEQQAANKAPTEKPAKGRKAAQAEGDPEPGQAEADIAAALFGGQ